MLIFCNWHSLVQKYSFNFANCYTREKITVMKRIILLILSALALVNIANAQQRVVDVMDNSPIASATIFDTSGSVVGITSTDGDFSEVPASAYPITIRCIGFEQLEIDSLENKVWQMVPIMYELEDAVISAKPQVLKQTFYVREYTSLTFGEDEVMITYFTEHMADRFIPANKDVKFSKNSMRILRSRCYERIKVADQDSVAVSDTTKFLSVLEWNEPDTEPITPHKSLINSDGPTKVYEKEGKSGAYLIQKQNAQTFTIVEDILAKKKDHSISLWGLKLFGVKVNINEWYTNHIYRANDKNLYMPKDLIEASFMMEAEGTWKKLSKALKSDKPLRIRTMVEMYVVDRDYLSKEDAKKAYENKPTDVEFEIPASVPELNEATQELVKRANNQ